MQLVTLNAFLLGVNLAVIGNWTKLGKRFTPLSSVAPLPPGAAIAATHLYCDRGAGMSASAQDLGQSSPA